MSASCNLSQPFVRAGQKLGFLRDLLEFRTRKFSQLGHDFIETHLQIFAHLGRVTTLNITLNSAMAAPKASHCAVGSHLIRDHSTSSRLRRPTRSKNEMKVWFGCWSLPFPSPPLKQIYALRSRTRPIFFRPEPLPFGSQSAERRVQFAEDLDVV
jgi:hypothetical protein